MRRESGGSQVGVRRQLLFPVDDTHFSRPGILIATEQVGENNRKTQHLLRREAG
jgi:hypothetical protein